MTDSTPPTDALPSFTAAEAQYLVEAAQSAPLRNLQHAQQLTAVLQRFMAWYAVQSPPKVAATTGK